MSRRFVVTTAALVFMSAGLAMGQQSSSYSLTEASFNAGGRPEQGTVATSASFQLTHDAIGDAMLAVDFSSPSFQASAGFVSSYAPAGEVFNLRWTSDTDLDWDAPASALTYNVYRDGIVLLPGNFGACFQQDLTVSQTSDATVPTAGSGRYYLVTASNRLDQEGTKGVQSDGTLRGGSACP